MMFKIFFARCGAAAIAGPASSRHRAGRLGRWPGIAVIHGLAVLIICGCAGLSRSLPPVDLKQPGWVVHQGQAVWKLPHSQRDVAGDVTVALGPDDRSFVQFSKTPFPLVIGQTTAKRWQVEFPPQNKHYIGSGAPPLRAMWLYLPRVLAGKPPPAKWTWSNSNGNWRLANPKSGESIEGFFSQ